MKKVILMVVALVSMAGVLVPSANALSFSIGVGDQPYYLHGPGYWVGPTYYVWVPGHEGWRHGHRVWVHGHYAPRH